MTQHSAIALYNSLTHTVSPFVPQVPGQVSLYCCGVTVYDHCHIGHGRIFVTMDLLQRLFRFEKYKTLFIRNITDIDDKILNRAKQLHLDWRELAHTYTLSMQNVSEQLGCLPPQHEPKATESIPQIIEMIQTLIQKGHAYIIENEVFFSVSTFPSYGALSNQDLSALEAGQRVAIAHQKRHPHDFTLWKPSEPELAGWDSPWGRGRPGWHIECSAMIASLLTGSLDFHMGGMDLKFPHHENEIAQSQCCYNHPLSASWLHVGFVTVDGEKMSKSLNNFKYVSEFMEAVSPEVTRYLYLSTQYRQPIALSDEAIRSAQGSLRSLGQLLGPYKARCAKAQPSVNAELLESLMTPCREDLNIPMALAILHSAAKGLAALEEKEATTQAHTLLYWAQEILGLDLCVLYSETLTIERAPQAIQEIAAARLLARQQKDYSQSDRLRLLALEHGYEILDTAEGMMCKALK